MGFVAEICNVSNPVDEVSHFFFLIALIIQDGAVASSRIPHSESLSVHWLTHNEILDMILDLGQVNARTIDALWGHL